MSTNTVSATDGGSADSLASQLTVLARCWQEPDERLGEALEAGLFADAIREEPSVRALQAEYTRLFVGPGDHPCPPYESVYRNREPDQELGQVLGASTAAVRKWYLEYGVSVDESWHDLPDHVAAELEFAGHLAAGGEDDALDRFCAEHLQVWLPEFLERVESHADEAYYTVLAGATADLIDRLQ